MLRRLPLAPTLRWRSSGSRWCSAWWRRLGIGNLFEARQDYEDELARTYELQSASSRLLAAGVIEETSFRERGAGARGARRRAARGLRRGGRPGAVASPTDPESARLVRARIAAQRRARRLAAPHPAPRGRARRPNAGWRSALRGARGERGPHRPPGGRRAEARDEAARRHALAL